MATAKSGDTVVVHYTGRLDDGTVFDSSENRNPIRFTLGSGEIIPGFERAVEGMAPGERKTVRIPAEDAYGPRREDAVFEVPRSQLPAGFDPEEGERYAMSHPDGSRLIVRVAALTNDAVTFDANHPLAGQDLTFEITLVSIG
jgi:peptidylprolyl isomerase